MLCFNFALFVFLKPEIPQDPEEAARLQQLQAAAAQWQQVQQQRASLQYQALMQQHEKLQQILEKYQQLIQQPANLQVGKNNQLYSSCQRKLQRQRNYLAAAVYLVIFHCLEMTCKGNER